MKTTGYLTIIFVLMLAFIATMENTAFSEETSLLKGPTFTCIPINPDFSPAGKIPKYGPLNAISIRAKLILPKKKNIPTEPLI